MNEWIIKYEKKIIQDDISIALLEIKLIIVFLIYALILKAYRIFSYLHGNWFFHFFLIFPF